MRALKKTPRLELQQRLSLSLSPTPLSLNLSLSLSLALSLSLSVRSNRLSLAYTGHRLQYFYHTVVMARRRDAPSSAAETVMWKEQMRVKRGATGVCFD